MKRDDLVKNIKEFCILKGINVRDMELALGFSPGLISRWTRMSPSFDKIIKVAEYLGASLDSLVSGQREKNGNDFLERLYKKTDEKKIEWSLCGRENPFSYPINELKELETGGRAVWQPFRPVYHCLVLLVYFFYVNCSAVLRKRKIMHYLKGFCLTGHSCDLTIVDKK